MWQKVFLIPVTLAVTISFFYNLNREHICECDVLNTTCVVNNTESIAENKSINVASSEPVLNDFKGTEIPQPKFWLHIYDGNFLIFTTVKEVLNHLDFKHIEMDLSSRDTMHYDWDLLWSYQFHDIQPLPIDWSKLKIHQKINHIPGNHRMTSKSLFGTTTVSKYVPKAFTDVDSLREYTKNHPDKLFVMKLKSNRGVQLKNVTEMNLLSNSNTEGYFAQEFIANPLLFNGHKFDFGVYVLVTSVNPLRVYYYTQNMIFRFCPKTYDISDPSDTDRYVVSDSKIPVWVFNGTKDYFDHGYNTRDAFNGFLKSVGADVDETWGKIEDCIRSIIVSKEIHFIEWLKKFKTSKFNHFELFRFDMIFDSNHNLHVIEINQHPNIYPSANFRRNKVLYQNLLYNIFKLIGVGTNYRKESLTIPSSEIEMMIANSHSMSVKSEVCMSEECKHSCEKNCNLCWKCLNNEQKYEMREAYREQLNVGEFKRIFPPENRLMKYFRDAKELSTASKLHLEWFNEMCKKNRNFC